MVRADDSCCRIRECGIHGQEDPDEEEQVLGDTEDGRAEEERGSSCEQREHQRREQQPRPWSQSSQADSESFAAQCTSSTNTRLRTCSTFRYLCSKFELASSVAQIFPWFFLQTVSYTTPTTNRESVLREIKLGILDRTDLQGHLSLNCIVLEIAIARPANGIGHS